MAAAPGYTQRIPLPYGPLGDFLHDPLAFQRAARERFGDVFRFRVGPIVTHFLFHPDGVHRVLVEHQKNYLRGWQYRFMKRLFGANLTTSEGAFWLRQRRLAQPAFDRRRLSGYADVMVDAASQLVSRWQAIASAAPAVEARREMSRVTLAITSRTLFDRDVSQEADEVGKAFVVMGEYFEHRMNHPVSSPPSWVPTSMNRRFKCAVSTINQIVAAIVRERRSDESDRGDLLSMLVQARDEETGERMTDEQLRSEVVNFLLAGYETTATALTWTFYLLASHPAVRVRVCDEVRKVIGDRLPCAADVPQLTVTRAVIQESMRLYPPVWAIPRQVVAADEIGGFRIPARSTVVLCPYVTHRHPSFWDAPEVFDPDRFTDERAQGRPKGAYFPFLGGPHQCIGNEFALMEMQLVVARILQEFDVTIAPGQDIKPTASLGLWPTGPIWLNVRATRSPSPSLP
ncbi:MAG TPA: cytochrome P450 [Pirellulales bacterium]|nr:cytochrome P450 [Pirellulales bacterium]